MTIELSIFTNSIRTAPNTAIIEKTFHSFVDTFGGVPAKIYFDPKPNRSGANNYLRNLRKQFGIDPIVTTSLSDGYVYSIKKSKADYLFQLEHDWIFQNINHTLPQILETMAAAKLYHFRFSKHPNTLTPGLMKWQTIMAEKESAGIKYCETDNLSNNPHIIDRKYYLNNLLSRIAVLPGSRGIEGNLTKKGLIGCQYGPLDYPPTIKHLHGRKTI
jgi:hypothetical protein